jgi:polysaccharide deacetylase 2 family uncharacterized protein YibQ
LRPSRFDSTWRIPRPGKSGLMPRQYYAAPASAAPGAPRIAVMVAGIGYALATGMAAVHDLPPAVSLAFSPYGSHLAVIARAARQAGHETMMGIPMRTAEEPAVTAGDKALSADAAREDNARHLDWTLSRLEGYAGATDTIGLDAPEVFLTDANEARWLLGTVGADGLFFVSTRHDVTMPEGVHGREADAVIAPAAGEDAERRALATAAGRAETKGSALVVLTHPAPEAIKVLAAWCATLARNLALVPVSALAEGN